MTEYPIFSGRVVHIPAVIEQGSSFATIIQYITLKDEPTEEETRKALFSSILPIPGGKELNLAQRIKSVAVPLRLDPAVLVGATIRSKFGELCLEGEAPQKTYEIEVVQGASRAASDPLMMLAEFASAPTHTGFRYIKILEE
ncbi:MAG: hypothetical protein Q7R96_05310 [Nanoarchaeota archaeon]|nr:hypothetical protein [Nanoarchaeota archaeon]